MQCIHRLFFSDLEDKCSFTQDCEYSFINWFSLAYCQSNWVFILILAILSIGVIFRFIQIIVDGYLAPCIESITLTLGISESLAAVTLLAFSNGAGDVVTAIAASNHSAALNYNIGALYGAGFFVATLVVGINIHKAGSLQLTAMNVQRDLGFYILATILIIVYNIKGQFTLSDSIGLLCFYALYVLFVVIQDKYFGIQEDEFQTLIELPQQNTNYTPIGVDSEEKRKSLLDLPLRIIIACVIPRSGSVLRITPIIPGLCLSTYVFTQNTQLTLYCLPISLIVALLMFLTRQYTLPIQIIAVICSIATTYLFSGILIDCLQFIGMLSNLSESYLAMTVIAFGNALPEALVTIKLCEEGFGVMAMTGAYAGQLFGLLVGLGLSLLRQTLVMPAPFEQDAVIFNINQIMSVLVISTFIVLCVTLVYGMKTNYKYSRYFGRQLILTYIIVITVLTIITIYNAVQQ